MGNTISSLMAGTSAVSRYDGGTLSGADKLLTDSTLMSARTERNAMVARLTGSDTVQSGASLAPFDPKHMGDKTGRGMTIKEIDQNVGQVAKLDEAIAAAEAALAVKKQGEAAGKAAAELDKIAAASATVTTFFATLGTGVGGRPGVAIQGPAPISGRPP